MKHSTMQWHDPADTMPDITDNAAPEPLLLTLHTPNAGAQVMVGAYLVPPEQSGLPPFPTFVMMMVMMSPKGPQPVYAPLDMNEITVQYWALWPQPDDLGEAH